jgi:hypothetical protein
MFAILETRFSIEDLLDWIVASIMRESMQRALANVNLNSRADRGMPKACTHDEYNHSYFLYVC